MKDNLKMGKIIVLSGIAGAGKSTYSEYINTLFTANGRKNTIINQGNNLEFFNLLKRARNEYNNLLKTKNNCFFIDASLSIPEVKDCINKIIADIIKENTCNRQTADA